jgi:hypothetical protein
MMIYNKYNSFIDNKLKNYILKLNNNYLERWKETKNKLYINFEKNNSNYIQDLQIDMLNSSKNSDNNILYKKSYVFYYWILFSFISGYQLRCLLN